MKPVNFKLISVVIPAYGVKETLVELHKQLQNVFSQINQNYEIIMVNDACPVGSWDAIETICKSDKNVKGVNLARNFGQHPALACGLAEATGDWIIVMDCDLQDDPANITALIERAKMGFDVVLAKRIEREEGALKRLQSFLFYKCLKFFLDVKMDHQVANYGLYSRKVIEAIGKMGDRIRFFPYLISWVGFSTSCVDVVQGGRKENKSSYTLLKALQLAFDVAIASSNRPLIWSVYLGGICSLSSFFLGIYFIVRYFALGLAPSGWTSLSVSVFFSTGLILFNLGIFGLYLARIYDQSKARPVFIIKEKINFLNV